MGGLEPTAEGFGDVGAAEALDRVREEGFPCRLRHGGLKGCLVGVGGGTGEDFLEGVDHVHSLTPARSPGPLHPAAELPRGGADHQARWVGARGAEGLEYEVLERQWLGLGVGGCVSSARGTGSSEPFVGGGGRGHGTAVARLVALGGAGAAVAGAGGWGCVSVAWGTGIAVPFVGGGGGGHGTWVARAVALCGTGTAGAGSWGVVAAPRGAGAVQVSG